MDTDIWIVRAFYVTKYANPAYACQCDYEYNVLSGINSEEISCGYINVPPWKSVVGHQRSKFGEAKIYAVIMNDKELRYIL